MAVSLTAIIPSYNRADYLRACVGSLKAGGVPDLEVIVVDDGSTDDTPKTARALGDAVAYVRQENAGPATARNHGFGLSQGRYVAFVDSDDEWLPGVAGRIVEAFDCHPEVDVVFAEAQVGNRTDGFTSWIETAGQAAFFELPCCEPQPGLRILEPKPFFRRMAYRNPVFISAVILRREAFDKAGRFDPALCGAADWELWLRMASRMTFAFWAEPLAIYTRHAECMSNNRDTMHREFCEALAKVLEKCAWLDQPERAWIEERLAEHLFGYAYLAYDRGDYSEARRRFADLLRRRGLAPRGLLYWAICALPFGLGGSMRRLKHALR